MLWRSGTSIDYPSLIFVHLSTEVVKGNGDLIPKAVKIWVERYEDSPRLATAELLSVLFEVNSHLFTLPVEYLSLCLLLLCSSGLVL